MFQHSGDADARQSQARTTTSASAAAAAAAANIDIVWPWESQKPVIESDEDDGFETGAVAGNAARLKPQQHQ